MRAVCLGLPTPFPLGGMLPPVLQEDPTAMRLTAGLDDVLAPVLATLDCLSDYFDPRVAPPDFLDWLGLWVGIDVDENWTVERRRATVACAVELHRARGTAHGMARYLEVVTGALVEVADSGGVAWSTAPDACLPGSGPPHVAVRITPRPGDAVDPAAMDALVRQLKPAFATHEVVVEPPAPGGPGRRVG